MADNLMIETALVARVYLYRLFQILFGDDPTDELLAALFSDTAAEALDCFASVESGAYAQARDALEARSQEHAADRASYLAAAKRDYTLLFVGPHELKAPPWECVYLTNERVLFQEATLKVREAYRSEGMLPSQYPHVSDDHIAIELDFMAKLSDKARSAFASDEGAEYRRLLEAQRGFLQKHLLTWVDRYVSDLSDAAPTSLYACVGALCAAFLRIDADVIGELLDESE